VTETSSIAARRRPNFFIIGAPKSGTTSLYEYLEGHPDIFMSPVKEPFYFSTDVSTGPRRRFAYASDHDAYLALYEGARGEKAIGEASTTYLVSRVAARLVAEFAPESRAIAMLRDPVEVMQALHNERVSHGVEPLAEFEDALGADADRREGRRLPEGASPLGSVYRDSVRFGEQLERWIAALGRERVHVVVFDDFVADTAAEFRRVLAFLGVDDAYQPDSFGARNPSHRIRRGPIRRLLASPLVTVVRQRLMPALLGEERSARLARRFRHSRLVRQRNQRAPIDAELRRQLEAELRPDVERLSALVGRDLVQLWFGHGGR
jgi:hypothetical protein